MNYIELKETVTPKKYGEFCYSEYEMNGHKFRDIDMMHEDGIIADIGTEILTPHCGWVADTCDPSFDCKQCDDSCYRCKQWLQFYERGY